eukprot:CAMPEP_0174898560 /NCGR_PEP_ID=MMETSP0167-20121228/22231_1 /TAXON_ID=38298 /ORGANISM="Rhodella maculata, Strain CCMP736" /LENGTH=47 /DNA_ID= /DNA_START= /DNA_END= /DNA_ORIENTATION=
MAARRWEADDKAANRNVPQNLLATESDGPRPPAIEPTAPHPLLTGFP